MAEQSNIEWTDSTWSGWEGCTKVGPGCDNCYAENRDQRFHGGTHWGPGAPRERHSEAYWRQPLKWNDHPFCECCGCGWRGMPAAPYYADRNGITGVCPNCGPNRMWKAARRRVFCASLSDWLDNEVPIEWLVDLLDLIRRTPNLDWLLLSKRIGNWQSRIAEAAEWKKQESLERLRSGIPCELGAWLVSWASGHPPANVWIGATVVNQQEADRDVPKLFHVPARVRFVSVEPMLGRIDLPGLFYYGTERSGGVEPLSNKGYPMLDWVICGGESGPKARPMHPDWVRSLRDQCAAAGVPFLFKQWGEWREAPPRGQREDFPDFNTALGRGGKPPAFFVDTAGNVHCFTHQQQPSETVVVRIGKHAAGNHLDGRQHLEWPETGGGHA